MALVLKGDVVITMHQGGAVLDTSTSATLNRCKRSTGMIDTDPSALLAPSDARIEALEIHAAHQARVIEDLNATVAAQWTAIDTLRRQLDVMVDRLEAAETRAGPAPAQRPPHY